MSSQRPVGQEQGLSQLKVEGAVRNLVLVLGDQLDSQAGALTQFDKARDAAVMLEVMEESTHVASHKQRTTLFLSAMRHFAIDLQQRNYRVHYVSLDDPANTQSMLGEVQRAVCKLRPKRLVCTHPGEWRVKRIIEAAASRADVQLLLLPDEHFIVTDEEFAAWMTRRKRPVMEHFYREQRRRLNVLIEDTGEPTGGHWNYDKSNRTSFRRAPVVPRPYTPRQDKLTRDVIDLVNRRLGDNPGKLAHFRWPVTRAQARRALADFVGRRLSRFGAYQDTM